MKTITNRVPKNGGSNKRKYQRPVLHNVGTLKNITLKTGSVADFGSNQFQP